jgi:hypothetical protein
MFNSPGDHGVAHNPYAMGIGDHDGTVKKTGVFYPRGSGHFAISVERKPAGKHVIGRILSSGKNCSNAGADRPDTHLQFALARNQGCMTDFNAIHIRDCIQRARITVERDP